MLETETPRVEQEPEAEKKLDNLPETERNWEVIIAIAEGLEHPVRSFKNALEMFAQRWTNSKD